MDAERADASTLPWRRATDEEATLDMARRHVREAEHRLTAQETRVRELRAAGHDVIDAERLLEAFRDSLSVFRDHLAAIEQARVRRPIHRG
jgi:hypothetical protein